MQELLEEHVEVGHEIRCGKSTTLNEYNLQGA